MIWRSNELRRHGPTVVVTLGAAVTVAGTFVPWVGSGSSERSSYEVVELVDRLGFAPDGPFEVALRGWALVPLLLALATVAVWWGRPLLGGALGVVAAVYAGGVAAAVLRAPDAGLVRVLDGAAVTLVGAVTVLAGVTVAVLTRTTAPDRPAPRAAAPDGRS